MTLTELKETEQVKTVETVKTEQMEQEKVTEQEKMAQVHMKQGVNELEICFMDGISVLEKLELKPSNVMADGTV